MRVLHDALRPPDGKELEHLIITTFTLDLVSLLSVPLAFARFGGGGDADAGERDPIELLAAVERLSGRITVFHQTAAIAAPDRHRRLLSLVEDALVAIPAPRRGGVFHPKLWIATYVDNLGKRAYRLLCASRNLTADRCWDTILALEGTSTRSARPECKPLSDFIAWLSRSRRLTPSRATTIKQIARQLSSVRFEPPPPFQHVAFRPLGIRGYREDPISSARRDRLLVVSPYVGAEQLAKLCAGVGEAVLVTRPEELARLSGPTPASVSRTLRLDDALEAEPDEATGASPWLVGLHAKAYVADQGWNATLWTGSANATGAAFRQNVEFLVEVSGKKSLCGVDKVLGDGSYGTFASMLVPLDEVPPPPEDDPLERALEALSREIAELPIEVRTAEGETGWTLELARLGEPLTGLDNARVEVTPLASTASPGRVDLSMPVVARFDGLAAHEVSGLFVVELRLDAYPEVARSFVVAWPLVGAVPDRVRALLVELASDPSRMFAFIRMFLAGEEPSRPVGGGNGSGGEGEWGAVISEAPLLELLVQTLAREPKRLDELARWLPDLAAAASDGAGDELMRIWQPVWQARQELAE